MLQSSADFYFRQKRITAAGLLAARAARKSGLDKVVQVVTAYQLASARNGVDSVEPMIVEQGLKSDPVATVAVTSLAGWASDGRTLTGLFTQAETDYAFDLMVANQLQDMARFGSSLAATTNYAVTRFVRTLNPPSCPRCAVLAGRVYKTAERFHRHDGCDCMMIPTTLSGANDLLTNPNKAFEAGQIEGLTQAQTKALEDGADISQVINANRPGSLRTLDYAGRSARATLEGTTVRGVASTAMGGDLTKVTGERYRRTTVARLTPFSIYQVAENREDAIRLLKLYGYIF